MQAAEASVDLAIVAGGRLHICSLLIACLVLIGCVRATFTPLSSADGQLAQVARRAVLAQEADVDALATAEGRVVGTMEAASNAYSSMSAVRAETLKRAARVGATHVIVATSWKELVKLTPDRATTTCTGNTCDTTFREGMTGSKKYMSSVLLRVEPDRWVDLPPLLRPEPVESVRAQVEASVQQRKARDSAELDARATAALGEASGIELAPDIGFELGMTPDAFTHACSAFPGGKVRGVVEANQLRQECRLPERPLPVLGGLHCRDDEHVERLCGLAEQSDPVSPASADEMLVNLSAHVDAKLGPAKIDTAGNPSWQLNGYTVYLFAPAAADSQLVSIAYATPEGIQRFNSTPPSLPQQIAGFTFGAPETEVQATCTSQGGTFIGRATTAKAKPAGPPAFECRNPNLDLPLQVATVRGLLCDGTLCEVGLVLSSPAANARATLESKYGPARAVPNDAPGCKRGDRFTWLWAEDDRPTGAITLMDDCEVTAFYDDGRGLAVRERQARQRLQSF